MKLHVMNIFIGGALVLASSAVSAAYLMGGSGYCEGLGCIGFPIVACAPEVKEGNVAAIERVTAQLLSTPDFAQATTAREELKTIQTLTDADVKIARYFKLVGVDAQNTTQVAEFLGAREIQGPWISSIKHNLQLSQTQAETLVLAIRAELIGDLQ